MILATVLSGKYEKEVVLVIAEYKGKYLAEFSEEKKKLKWFKKDKLRLWVQVKSLEVKDGNLISYEPL